MTTAISLVDRARPFRALAARVARPLHHLLRPRLQVPAALDPLGLSDHWLRDIGLADEAHARRALEAATDWQRLDRW